MNKQNIKYWYDGDWYYALWRSVAFDDEDPNPEDVHELMVKVPNTGDDRMDQKKANGLLANAYDQWIEETR